MKSVQWRLFVLLAFTTVVVSVAAGGALHAYLRWALGREFDRSLDVRSRGLQSLVTQRADGTYDVDIDTTTLREYAGPRPTEFFRITDPAGHAVAQSGPDAPADTDDLPEGRPTDHALPGGLPGRALRVRYRPQWEGDALRRSESTRKTTPLSLVVIRDRRPLDGELMRIGVAIVTANTVWTAVVLAATGLILRACLKSLRRLATQASEIDVTRPDARFETADLPRELSPIADRLNEMLRRVTAAMTRERRFTADVAHELRTPIAELRSAAEVALRVPSDTALGRTAIEQARDIAVQMQTVVHALLAIVRQDHDASPVPLRPTAVAPLIGRCLERLDPLDAGQVVCAVPDGLLVFAEPTLLAAVIDNLLSNAVRYGVAGRPVQVDGVRHDGGVTLSFANAQDALAADDLAEIFKPFWRKQASRSDGQHVGLGLALAKSYCRAMDVGIAAALPTPGTFRVTLTLVVAAEGADTGPRADAHVTPQKAVTA